LKPVLAATRFGRLEPPVPVSNNQTKSRIYLFFKHEEHFSSAVFGGVWKEELPAAPVGSLLLVEKRNFFGFGFWFVDGERR
jgi:hypothetical protein